jgi:N-acetylmuramoyl-L-alanine amidase
MKRPAALLVATALTLWLAPLGGAAGVTLARAAGVSKPKIVWDPIPFGARRKREMAAYSQRHYGKRTWHLSDPHVIVEHYTDGTTYSGAWSTFASNVKHLGELPGTCAHFIIDTDGTIYQLVRLGIRCRHVIGINHTSIGIEHVGTSDGQILHNRAMMQSSLHLTLWLMQRYGINVGNVIGHAESLANLYHREKYPSWRCQTHSDWLRPDMRIYRRRLRTLARSDGVGVGGGPTWDLDC